MKNIDIEERNRILLSNRNAADLTLNNGIVFWLTGLSGAGKTTLANIAHSRLASLGVKSFVLDGDIVRNGLSKDLGFADEDRLENCRRIAEVAKLLARENFVVLVSCISPFRKDRAFVESLFCDKMFFEIYIQCSIAICESRDVKGLYKKARLGLIPKFTGVSSPYEVPEFPDFVVATDCDSIDYSSDKLLGFLFERMFAEK